MNDIMIFQPKQAGATISTSKLNGGSGSKMTGTICMLNGEVQFNGGSGTNAGCVLLVADNVDFSGNADWKNVCGDTDPKFAAIRLRLLS